MIASEYKIGPYILKNRLAFQPMEGFDCGEDGSPGELTKEKYRRFVRGDAAIVWFEANAVCEEGKTNKRQMGITRDNLDSFKFLVDELKNEAVKNGLKEPVFIFQLTHSGRQSMKPVIAFRNELYEARRPMCDEYIASDSYLDSLPQIYANSARLALEAGFDGIDVKSCHGYLVQELLSAYSREGKYGGTLENRSRLFLDCARAVKAILPSDRILASRFGVSDMVKRPYGFGTDENGQLDLREALLIIESLRETGIQLLNITVGNPYYNPHVNRPYRKGAYVPDEAPEAGVERFRTIELAVKKSFPDLPLIASGMSSVRGKIFEEGEKLLEEGACDFVGLGRMALAYPDCYRDYAAGRFEERKACVTCSRCTTLMRNHVCSGCAVFNPYYKKLYDALDEEGKKL